MPDSSTSKPLIALFSHHPECSNQCCEGIERALGDHYNIQRFNEKTLDADLLASAAVVAFPGGIGDSDSYPNFFTRTRANRIARFLECGGHYLGICMGAYWAGERYFDILDDVNPVQYIKQPNADVKRSYGTVASVTWKDQKEEMYFYDGCALIGDETKFKTIARYSNGDPMAIIQGRIGIIGCHPEAPLYWYEKPWHYINKYWHGGRHHQLLLQFVNELTETK